MKTTISKESFAKKATRGFVVTIAALAIFAMAAAFYYQQSIGPVNVQESKTILVEIPKGASTIKIAQILKEKGLIKNNLSFRMLSKLSKVEGKMQAGIYQLKNSMDAREIIKVLTSGDVVKDTVKFTIPEGFELRQIVDRLEGMGLIDRKRFIELVQHGEFHYKFLEGVPQGENRLEGFLFPDTYEISKNAFEEEIIKKMLERFDAVFKEEYYQRAKQLNMSVHEVVTLASIIEREAKLDKERPLVSSVFHNRLKKGMLLQSCATVQYVLGERKENLSLKDIDIDSPYNTYKNIGLPPAPIASPGKASIEAALYPAQTDYYYFVAKTNGEHAFSKTYEEHLRAKNANDPIGKK
ncbi:endolytic transglycosylase MltG [Thermotalea metallivorans]|uniref:Endolytic murein transglycosylase n=1 Tax=Thermotalea metallivorans TaxID=520762 RepID=A0A140L892_9FIRM|nr:endolytic transglycosylase MltG [Thermotalea metallivorans]KXG76767.1 hypothetical protein AN619_07590 [Thermotalea metallivorans]